MLKFLVILLLVLLIIRMVAKYLVPLLVSYFFKKVQQNLDEQLNTIRKKQNPEGTITVDDNNQKTQSKKPDVNKDDYIDFEEV